MHQNYILCQFDNTQFVDILTNNGSNLILKRNCIQKVYTLFLPFAEEISVFCMQDENLSRMGEKKKPYGRSSAERKGEAMKETCRKALSALAPLGRKAKGIATRLPMMRITALTVMLMITVSSVVTVLAATKDITVTVDGETVSASAIADCSSEEEARDLLRYLGYDIPEGSAVAYTVEEDSGNIEIEVRTPQKVTVKADGDSQVLYLPYGDTVETALKDSKTVLDDNDLVSPGLTAAILEDTSVVVTRRYGVKVTADGSTKDVTILAGDAASAVKAAGVTLGEEDFLSVDADTPVTEGMEISVSRVTYETKTTEEVIDYKTVEKEDNTLYKGRTQVETEGSEGLREIKTQYKYIDGKLAETKVLSKTVTKEPVDRVVRVGTKSAVSHATVTGGTVYDQNGNPVKYTKMIAGRCSAYTGGGICSTGLPAAVGRVAVNPNIIPYGTKLFICSPDGSIVYGYAVAADTGGGCMNGIILADLYMDTLDECRYFGSRTMNVYILG